jgi:hypothetical protein
VAATGVQGWVYTGKEVGWLEWLLVNEGVCCVAEEGKCRCWPAALYSSCGLWDGNALASWGKPNGREGPGDEG